MIYYLLLPFLLLLLVIFQVSLLDVSFLARIGVEISLIVVMYGGLCLNVLMGGAICLLTGFFLDCLNSAIFGLYTFLYSLIFSLCVLFRADIYVERPLTISLCIALGTILEGLIIGLIYRFYLGANVLASLPPLFLAKAMLLGLLGPFVFAVFKRFKGFLNEHTARPAQRL